MGYLDPTEYVTYGLAAETADDWVATASALMEAHCRRPSLLATRYTERFRLAAGRQALRLSYLPLTVPEAGGSPLIAVRARMSSARAQGLFDSFFDEVSRAFSVDGSWSDLEVQRVDCDGATGEVTLPVNFLGFAYREVEVEYMAGPEEASVALKVACAQIVRNAQATPALNVRASRVDSLQMQYFSGSLLDENVVALLQPYVAQRLG